MPKRQSSPRGKAAQEANSSRGKISIWPKKAKQYSGIVEVDDVDETWPKRQNVDIAKEGTIVF
jgi:hypothetical protein